MINYKTHIKSKDVLVEINDENLTPLYCINWLKCKYKNEVYYYYYN